jgi:S1-C subfamily serine protease
LKKHGFEEMPAACEKIQLIELDSCLINVTADLKKKTQERTQGTHKPVTRERVTTLAKGFTVQPLEPGKDAQSAVGPNSVQGWIGVTTTHFESGGAVVTAVAAGSPAAKAGLRPGDVINTVNGISLKDQDLGEKIAAYKPGSIVRVGYMRDSWALEAVVTVGTNAR